jgi:hypothetical protein
VSRTLNSPLRTLGFALLIASLAAGVTIPVRPLAAQEAPSQDSATARTLFMQGTRAAKDGDWLRARDSFAASYALHQSPRTLFNLGIARAQLGELVAGSEALRAFLRGADPQREADNIAIAKRELLRIEPLIAYVRVDASSVRADDQLEVDGRLLPSGALGTELPLDPGGHHIRWIRPERVVAEERIDVKPGERATVALEATAEPAPVVVIPPPSEVQPAPEPVPAQVTAPALATSPLPGHDDVSLKRRRWLIGGGIAAVVVGAVIASVFIVRKDDGTERETLEPVAGNVADGVVRIP